MSKGRYRVRDCQDIDWKDLCDRAGGDALVFAVDVAKEAFVAALVGSDGAVLERVKWSHPAQTRLILDGLVALQGRGEVVVAMESSGSYGDALRWQLHKRAIAVYRVSAKHVHDSAEVYDGVASLHDAKAADLIALLHQHARSRRWELLDEQRRDVNALVQRLDQLKAQQQRQRNRLEALLSRHWPELSSVIDLNSISAAQLIAALGSPCYVRAFAHRGEAKLHEASRGHLGALRIAEILESARTTLGMPCSSQEQALLRAVGRNLLALHQEILHLTHELEGEVAQDKRLQSMAEVIGAVTATVFYAHLGASQRYPNAHSYLKAMGLNLKEHSSGKHKGALKITKRGASKVRFYLYFAALRLIAQDPRVMRWFKAKCNRPGAIKGKVIVELMRKLAKGLWHLGQGEPFSVARLFAPPPMRAS